MQLNFEAESFVAISVLPNLSLNTNYRPTDYRKLITDLLNANGKHPFQIVLGKDAEGDERFGAGDAGNGEHLFRNQFGHCVIVRHANDGDQIKTTAYGKHLAYAVQFSQSAAHIINCSWFYVEQNNCTDHLLDPFLKQ